MVLSNDTLLPRTAKANGRLLSLDVFRGATVAAMILVNNPGDWAHIYRPFEHSEWNGCTLADLIFPFFLYIIGVSIVFAMQSKKREVALYKTLPMVILKRTLVLLFLALFLSWFLFFRVDTMRIPGVLGRIALVYGICGFIYIKAKTRVQLLLFWLFIILYYYIMCFLPVPGIGVANLNPQTNMGAWVDRLVFGTAHLWKESVTWDPEGLLGTIPSVSTGLFGVLAGTWLKRTDVTNATKLTAMLLTGVLSVAIGLIWNMVFPINKSLWTSSYVLFTGGLATITLAVLFWLIDVRGYKQLTLPFVVFGLNAITVYVGSTLMARSLNLWQMHLNGKLISLKDYIFKQYFEPFLPVYTASLLFGLCFVLIWFVVLFMMYKKKIVLKA